MATEIIMPQMGESIAEGTITKWLAEVGSSIERDQPLLEISTDKVDAEIPSPVSGVLSEVLFQEGDTVEVDTVIGFIGEPGEATSTGTSTGPGTSPVESAAPSVAPAVIANEATQVVSATGSAADQPPVTLEERVRTSSSPVVRKIAKEEGVDVSQVMGTGIHGRVTKRDILQYLEDGGSSAAVAEPTRASAPSSVPRAVPRAAPRVEGASLVTRNDAIESRAVQDRGSAKPAGSSNDELSFSVAAYTPSEPVEIEPMSRVRKLTAAHMLYSRQTSAHVATVFEIDMSNVVAARNRARKKFQERVGTKLTYMPFIFKAVADGLQSYPKFNASVDGTDIVYKKDINLGMAVAVDWGLLVPVIPHADQLNLVGLARTANDLADRARTKKLSPDELQRGTFTITNPGVFGSLYGIPIINQPQVAILCLGAIEKRAVVMTDDAGNDSIAIRTMCHFCLSYDHRLIDGADAEKFMNRLKRTLVESAWDELDAFC